MFGILVTLLIGPSVPAPAPPELIDALDGIEVTHNDDGRSGFQLRFNTDIGGGDALLDYPLLRLPQLKPFSRVIVMVTFGVVPTVLMDGVITHTQLQPSAGGERPATLTVTGEDVSVMMDLEEKSVEHPAQAESIIALALIGSYAQYGLVPVIVPPPTFDVPLPMERVPAQQGTDLAYLKEMAGRYGYVFYVAPGPSPFTNMAYWGPPKRTDLPQHALSTDLGPDTNVESIHFTNNALTPMVLKGRLQDRESDEDIDIEVMTSLRPPLSAEPAVLANQPNVRSRQFRSSGLTSVQAFARAQGELESSSDVVTAQGELDAVRYGNVLQSRALVDVRGAGQTNNGTYYVKSVSHSISAGSYRQSFTLTREGTGALLPLVVP